MLNLGSVTRAKRAKKTDTILFAFFPKSSVSAPWSELLNWARGDRNSGPEVPPKIWSPSACLAGAILRGFTDFRARAESEKILPSIGSPYLLGARQNARSRPSRSHAAFRDTFGFLQQSEYVGAEEARTARVWPRRAMPTRPIFFRISARRPQFATRAHFPEPPEHGIFGATPWGPSILRGGAGGGTGTGVCLISRAGSLRLPVAPSRLSSLCLSPRSRAPLPSRLCLLRDVSPHPSPPPPPPCLLVTLGMC